METINAEFINSMVEKMKNTPVRISMYTFLYGIASVADPKVKSAFVGEYAKTFVNELCESEEIKGEMVKELTEYFLNETKK